MNEMNIGAASRASRMEIDLPEITPSDEKGEVGPSRRYAHYVLLLLALSNALAFIDRGMVSMIVEPLKADLGLSDSQIGILTGFAFVACYSLCGIPFARWSDRGNRKTILVVAVSIWSIGTLICGFVANFAQLVLARIMVGVGEAGGTPPALSLIPDLYAKDERPQAIGIFRAAPLISIMIGMPLAGWLAQEHGWRATFLVFGLIGFPLALLMMFTMREQVRGRHDPGGAAGRLTPPPLGVSLRLMLASSPFMLMFVGMSVLSFSSSIGGTWTPAFLMRVHHLSMLQVGLVAGGILSTVGVIGVLIGGSLASRLLRKGYSDRVILLMIFGLSSLSIPAQALYVFSDSVVWCLVGGAAAIFFIGLTSGPSMAAMLELMPPSIRGLTAAMVVLATSLIPGGLAPLVVGILSDSMSDMGNAESLRYALSVKPFTLLIGTIFCIAAAFVWPPSDDGRQKKQKADATKSAPE